MSFKTAIFSRFLSSSGSVGSEVKLQYAVNQLMPLVIKTTSANDMYKITGPAEFPCKLLISCVFYYFLSGDWVFFVDMLILVTNLLIEFHIGSGPFKYLRLLLLAFRCDRESNVGRRW